MTALFYGRSHITGLDCGSRVRFRGQVGMRDGGPVMINPAYELVAPGTAGPPPEAGSAGEDSPPPDSPLRRRGGRRKEPWPSIHAGPAPPAPDKGRAVTTATATGRRPP